MHRADRRDMSLTGVKKGLFLELRVVMETKRADKFKQEAKQNKANKALRCKSGRIREQIKAEEA
jgi:hypothetical protein